MEEKEKKNLQEITPSQYFDYLKNAKNVITTDALKKSFSAFLQLGEKYNKLGQVESLKKLCFLADVLKKEEKLIELGINTYVYKDVIEDYIENVADKTVKIVELSRYMREIPDEFVETIEKSRELFDELYVVFTDYTGKEERKVEKERRDKDPILFGVFKNGSNISDRFYFLGDWIDEYCDLTLDKMIEEYQHKCEINPTLKTEIPQTTDELISILKSYKIDEKNDKPFDLNNSQSNESQPNNENEISQMTELVVPSYKKDFESEEDTEPAPGFFDKIRTIFKKSK